MKKLAQELSVLLGLIDEHESQERFEQSDAAHNSLVKLAQQAQGNAYNTFDMSGIPPAISAMLANLNYKVTQLTNTQQQMAQQMGGVTGTPPKQQQQQQNPDAQYAAQQFQNTNQNPITPNTVNYVQTPGSNPAPIQVDDGEINV